MIPREKAKQLRDSGMTFKAIGKELGVSVETARRMVIKHERYLLRLEKEKENPSLIPWHRGLSNPTIMKLEMCGFRSKEDCQILCSDDLQVYRRSIALPGWVPCDGFLWQFSDKRLSITLVNEVRAWLGVKPFVLPARQVTEKELDRAKNCLKVVDTQL